MKNSRRRLTTERRHTLRATNRFLIKEGAVAEENIETAQTMLAQLTKLSNVGLQELHPELSVKVEEYMAAVQNLEGGLAEEEPQFEFEGRVKEAANFIARFENGMTVLPQLLYHFFTKEVLNSNQGEVLADLANSTRDNPDSHLRTKYLESIGAEKLRKKLVDNFAATGGGHFFGKMGRAIRGFVRGATVQSDAEMIADGLMGMTVGEVLNLVNRFKSSVNASVPASKTTITPPTPARTPTGSVVSSPDDVPTRRNMRRPRGPKRELTSLEQKMVNDLKLTVKSGNVKALRDILSWLIDNGKLHPADLHEVLRREGVSRYDANRLIKEAMYR